MRTKHYSDVLQQVSNLIGVAVADLETQETTIINGFFNKAMKQIWQQTNWLDVCPYGEYRVPNNLLNFSKAFANTTWTATNVTIASNVIPNPVDVQSQADQMLETTATGVHGVSQSATFGATQYSTAIFAQASLRNYIQIKVTDSASATYSAIFNLSGINGTVTTLGANTSAVINVISGLWYQCMITYTPAAGAGTVAFNLSTDGSTTSYTGNASDGAYIWGASTVPTQPSGVSQQLIPWEQPGETAIDIVLDVFNMTPLSASLPSRIGYKLTNNGIQLINSTTGWNAMYYVQNPQAATTTTDATPLCPVYLSYRSRVPDYTGSAYDASATYVYGNQIYFTNADGSTDYYSCLIPTSAGQSPTTTPAAWSVLAVPYVFFDYACYQTFADWLRTEGQLGKAQIMEGVAQDLMDREADRQERQMGAILPMRVHTHLTSRPNFTR